MEKKWKKHSVCTGYLSNERGFNLISVLFMLTMIFMSLPFLSYALQVSKSINHYDELAVHEFFRFIRDDILLSTSFDIGENAIYLHQPDQTVTISQYESVIRRQVDRRGHEIYLRDVKRLTFEQVDYGIKLLVTTEEGVTYEKFFAFYYEKV